MAFQKRPMKTGTIRTPGLVPGLALTLGLSLALLSAAAAAASAGKLPLQTLEAWSPVIFGLALFAGCGWNALRAGTGKLVRAGLTGVLGLALVLVPALALDGGEGLRWTRLLALALTAAALGGLAGSRRKKPRFA